VTTRRRAVPLVLAPGWLDPVDVAGYLRLPVPTAAVDTDLLSDVCAAAEPVVVRHRSDIGTDQATIPADVYQGAVMLAARLFRRRNSPAGIESMGESVTYVASFDPDLDQFLRRGRYRIPGVG
jgi:hypothetical protein